MKKILLAGKILLTLLVIWFVYRRISIAEFTTGLQEIRYEIVLLGLTIAVPAFFIDAYRQRLVLQAWTGCNPISYWALANIRIITSLFTILLPGGIVTGEAVNAIKLFRHYPKKAAVIGVTLDKAIGFTAIMAVTLLMLLLDSNKRYHFEYPAIIILSAILISGYLVSSPYLVGYFRLLPKRIRSHTVINQIEHLFVGFALLKARGKAKIAVAFLLAVISHSLGILSVYFFSRSVGIQCSFVSIGWMSGALCIIQILPITVFSIGLREASYAFFLKDYGVGLNQSILLCVVLYFYFIIYVLIGLIFFMIDNIRSIQKNKTVKTHSLTQKT